MIKESPLKKADAIFFETLSVGDYFLKTIRQGDVIRIVDLEGNQATDTLFYNANDPSERYSAMDTVREQGALNLTAGTMLKTNLNRDFLEITADTCGRHDPVGGAGATDSNTVRYDFEKRYKQASSNRWMLAIQEHESYGLTQQDITHNINFFMNVPVTKEGTLTLEDSLSSPGKYIELRAKMDTLVLISNSPQLNNPGNAYNPTPVEVIIWQDLAA